MTRTSPLIPAAEAAAYAALPPPAPHTPAELAALIRLVARSGHHTVTIGHSRDSASVAAAGAFAAAWQSRGGQVLDTVDWPEHAASWLRPARRLTARTPDAWVIAASPLGWAQMSSRLLHSTTWTPNRTFSFTGTTAQGTACEI
ncbi:hypothetical protein [Streptomyces sp. NPDC058486]|uniref:hypothetical protein n=1 Tax=unclassified Streptomyces TaxID=2593676 RepID=UPI00365EBF24